MLIDVHVAEDAPQAVAGGVFRAEEGRVFEKEADIGELGLEFGEEDGQRLLVAGEVLVTLALVVIQLANLAVLEFRHFLPLFLSLLLLATFRTARV